MATAFQRSAFQDDAFQIDGGFTASGGRRHGSTTYARKTLSRLEREKRRRALILPPVEPAIPAPVPAFALSELVMGNPLDPSVTFRPFEDDEDEAIILLLAAA